MKWMDKPSVTEMERGVVYEMEIKKSPLSISVTLGLSIHFILTKTLLKKIEYKYGHSHFKSAFGINFGLWEVVKLKIRKYAYLHNFQFDHFQNSKIYSKSRFEMRMSIFLFKKKFKTFGQYEMDNQTKCHRNG